jgi:hypothetical protein
MTPILIYNSSILAFRLHLRPGLKAYVLFSRLSETGPFARGVTTDMKNRAKALLLSVSLVLAWCDRVHPQEPLPTTKNYILRAQEFLNALYPDLKGKWYMSIEASQRNDEIADQISRAFRLYLGEAPKGAILGYVGGYTGARPENYQPGPIYPKQYLTCDFDFDGDGRLVSFDASGPAIGKPNDAQKFDGFISSHPEVSDLQATRALQEAGAKFGSWNKDKFMEHLPKKDLERFVGKLSITSAEFPLPEDHVLPNGWPLWTVIAEATGKSGTKLIYKMEFEPFKGDLTSLTTVPFPPIADTGKQPH